jgi:hypothetical protein
MTSHEEKTDVDGQSDQGLVVDTNLSWQTMKLYMKIMLIIIAVITWFAMFFGLSLFLLKHS